MNKYSQEYKLFTETFDVELVEETYNIDKQCQMLIFGPKYDIKHGTELNKYYTIRMYKGVLSSPWRALLGPGFRITQTLAYRLGDFLWWLNNINYNIPGVDYYEQQTIQADTRDSLGYRSSCNGQAIIDK